MNTLEHSEYIVEEPLNPKSPETPLEHVETIYSDAEQSFSKQEKYLVTQIESSSLSVEQQESFKGRASALLEKYTQQASRMRNIAVVALAINAAGPAFAQNEGIEQPNTEAVISNMGGESFTSEPFSTIESRAEDFTTKPPDVENQLPAIEEHISLEEYQPNNPEASTDVSSEISNIEDPSTTSSIILDALEAAAKNRADEIKENPIEHGAKFASKFAKGPIKHLGDMIDIAKSLKESADKKEGGVETAKKIGRLLLDIKTFGLGSLVLDLLESQTTKPE